MGETTQQASGTPGAEGAQGEPSEKTQTSTQAEADADRKQQPSPEEQLKVANDKLAAAGRETKKERDARVALEAEVATLREKTDKLWFSHPDTPEAEKDAYRKSRETEAKDAPKLAQANNRIALAEAIADEEDPTIRKALKALKTASEGAKVYPDASVIAAIRESLTPEGGTKIQTQEDALPNVSSSRGTQSSGGPSLDDQIKIVEASVRSRDGKYSYGDLLALRQQATQAKQVAARA